MDATAMVNAAAVWKSIPFSTSYRTQLKSVQKNIPSSSHKQLSVSMRLKKNTLVRYALSALEVVQVDSLEI